MPLRDGETILFLRLKGGYTGKGKERKSKIDTYVYSYNTKRGRERQIVKLKDFSPNRDLKDSCFFVDMKISVSFKLFQTEQDNKSGNRRKS